MSLSVMRPCKCGASSDAPNYECERCRLVYFVLTVRQLQEKQAALARRRDPEIAGDATRIASKVNKMLSKFCEPPKQQEFFDGDEGRYYERGA